MAKLFLLILVLVALTDVSAVKKKVKKKKGTGPVVASGAKKGGGFGDKKTEGTVGKKTPELAGRNVVGGKKEGETNMVKEEESGKGIEPSSISGIIASISEEKDVSVKVSSPFGAGQEVKPPPHDKDGPPPLPPIRPSVNKTEKNPTFDLEALGALIDLIGEADGVTGYDRSWICDVLKSEPVTEMIEAMIDLPDFRWEKKDHGYGSGYGRGKGKGKWRFRDWDDDSWYDDWWDTEYDDDTLNWEDVSSSSEDFTWDESYEDSLDSIFGDDNSWDTSYLDDNSWDTSYLDDNTWDTSYLDDNTWDYDDIWGSYDDDSWDSNDDDSWDSYDDDNSWSFYDDINWGNYGDEDVVDDSNDYGQSDFGGGWGSLGRMRRALPMLPTFGGPMGIPAVPDLGSDGPLGSMVEAPLGIPSEGISDGIGAPVVSPVWGSGPSDTIQPGGWGPPVGGRLPPVSPTGGQVTGGEDEVTDGEDQASGEEDQDNITEEDTPDGDNEEDTEEKDKKKFNLDRMYKLLYFSFLASACDINLNI